MRYGRTVVPSASRLMDSLRDIGYELSSAVADLVDNSVDAGASDVDIAVAHDGADSWLRIADNGHGMTAGELDEAMRYGASRQYGDSDLGRFGLGLKTASLSQCRRLTVATRTTATGRIEIRRWDLDNVARYDDWWLERLTPRQCRPELLEPLADSAGTVVLWERLDRVMTYVRPEGRHAESGLLAAAEEISEHLGVVFHRFLSKRGPARLRLFVNSARVLPWDPFATTEAGTQKLRAQRMKFTHSGVTHRLTVRPYVLPAQAQFSSPAAHMAAAGPKKWNRQQGFYIYRNDRLIQSGGWNRLRTMDEHSKLARIALDVPPGAEEAFSVNVSKTVVGLPDDLRPQLRTLAAGVVALAQDAYRARLRLVDPLDDSVEDDAAEDWGWGSMWQVVSRILHRELAHDPEMLERVLLALADARPDASGATEQPAA